MRSSRSSGRRGRRGSASRQPRCSAASTWIAASGPQALDWFERAAEAPAPTPDAGRALLYDLADALEVIGESGRALAVFGELDADVHGYRDVAQRLERLSRVQARG